MLFQQYLAQMLEVVVVDYVVVQLRKYHHHHLLCHHLVRILMLDL
jgi:hypothetical protein